MAQPMTRLDNSLNAIFHALHGVILLKPLMVIFSYHEGHEEHEEKIEQRSSDPKIALRSTAPIYKGRAGLRTKKNHGSSSCSSCSSWYPLLFMVEMIGCQRQPTKLTTMVRFLLITMKDMKSMKVKIKRAMFLNYSRSISPCTPNDW